MLAHGTMDNNVPPYNTLLVVAELVKANKDFDLVLFPNRAHGYGTDSNYMMRKRWDYFVRWLLNAEPPEGIRISRSRARRSAHRRRAIKRGRTALAWTSMSHVGAT